MVKNVIFLILFFCIYGYNSSCDDPVDNIDKENTLLPPAKTIEEVEFSHPAMKKCLLNRAEAFGWKSVDEVTSFACSRNGIDTLKGLDELYNLEDFNLSYTALTEIDLKFNPKLKQVIIMYNPYLKKVNLSRNLQLTRVFVNYNAVTEIDVSNLKNIIEANFTTNLLETVKFDDTSIYHISLGGNPIRNLNLSNAISIKDLRLQGCPLESLNVSNLHDLESLFIDETGLKRIDISNNRELTSFSASGNKITNIRFDNNPNLIGVSLLKNPLDDVTIEYLSSINWIEKLKY